MSARPIPLIFYADAISLLINATKTVACTEPFEQIARTHFTVKSQNVVFLALSSSSLHLAGEGGLVEIHFVIPYLLRVIATHCIRLISMCCNNQRYINRCFIKKRGLHQYLQSRVKTLFSLPPRHSLRTWRARGD